MLKQKADLYYAIKANNLYKVCEALSKFKVADDEFLDDKISFVSCAILNNCSDLIVNKLLEEGCNVNRISFLAYNWPTDRQRFNSFEPALITATRHGNLQLCEILLKHGAKINKSDSFHMTALHWASSLNLIEIVKALFKYNVNVNLTDLKKHTPLEKAILNNHIDIVQAFADSYMINSKCREYLLAAIESSNTEIFKILLNQIRNGKVSFDLNLIDESVGSLLHYAVILCNVNNLANGKQLQTTKDLDLKDILNSPLSKVKIIEALIDYGAEVDLTNKLGETPLHMCRNIDVARVLLDKGAKMNLTEITGKIPLYSFLLRANYDICIEMIQNGCEIDTTDRFNNSLLYTIMNSSAPVKLILLLIEAGVGLNEEWLVKKQYPASLKSQPKLVEAIEWRRKNPLSLKQLARRTVRTHLNTINKSKSIVSSVNQLEKHLPRSLHNYILLNFKELESLSMY